MRDKILVTARRLFIQQGYAGLSMREIAEAVGVSKPALYYHFRDKENLFLAIALDFLDEIHKSIAGLPGETPSGRIAGLIGMIMTLPLEQRALIRVLMQEVPQLPEAARASILEQYQEHFINKIQAIFEEGIRTGELKPVSAHSAVWSLLGLLYPYTLAAGAGPHHNPIDNQAAADQITDIFLHGLTRDRPAGS